MARASNRNGDEARPPGCAMVIFGASGDLTHRKLVPALYNLARQRLLPKSFAVVGFARSAHSNEDFRRAMADAVKSYAQDSFDAEAWAWLEPRLHYHAG